MFINCVSGCNFGYAAILGLMVFVWWLQNTVVASAGGTGMQAVALRVDSDKAMFYRVKIKGTQDTLLDNTGTHYFYRCLIEGKVDFIFGSAKSLYEVK